MSILSRPVVGIELKDHLAQFVELVPNGSKTRLSAYNRMPLPEGLIVNGEIRDEANLIEALRPLFLKSNPKIGRIKKASLVLPSRLTFVHIFNFPSDFSIKEIQKALPLQAETIIPFSIEDVYWDFSVTKSANQNEQRVIFAAVSKEQADRYARVVQSLGVTPFLFGIELDALASALTAHLQGTELKLVIDLNALTSNFLLMQGSAPVYFFSSNEGMHYLFNELKNGFKINDAASIETWDQLLEKKTSQVIVQKFLEKRFRQGQKIIDQEVQALGLEAVSSVILTGEFSTLTGSLERAQTFFRGLSIEAGDPKHILTVDESRFIKRDEDFKDNKLYSVFFTHVIGVAQRALTYKDTTSVNLLPSSLRARVRNQKLSFMVISFVIVMALINLSVSGYFIYLNQVLNYNRHSLEVQKVNVERKLFGTRYQEIQTALTAFNQEVSTLTSIDSALFSVPATLDQILALMPEGVEVTQLSFEDANLTLELEGVASNREVLFELQKNLEDSPLISEAVLPISNYDQKANISFHLSLTLQFTQLPDYGISTAQ